MTSETKALARLAKAARTVADVLDAGDRDPTWAESQELEAAAIAYGRAVRVECGFGCMERCKSCWRDGRSNCASHSTCPVHNESPGPEAA